MTSSRDRRRSYRDVLCAGLATAALLGSTPARSAPAAQIHIPAGPMDTALLALAAQTHEQLVFTPNLVAGLRAAPLDGRFTVEDALAHLLAGTDIAATRAGPSGFVLKPRSRFQSPSVTKAASEVQAARPFGGEADATDRKPRTLSAPTPPPAPAPVAELLVTGTHIRGGDTGASPLVVLDSHDLERSGQATVAAALNVLPQNYSGENTEASVNTGAARLGTNLTYATGVNLRGLGNDATLVLLNGRRLGGAGTQGDFTDLSTIPTIAVDRVEILLDGASAIYGSDAVGGVVNVILRKDLDGGEFRIRGGTSTDGGASEGQLGFVQGHVWSTGSVLIAYEGDLRGRLSADDRRYTRSADLREFGGSDFRLTNAFPGNIVGINPATGVSGPFYGIPAGQDGLGLTPSSFHAGVLNLTSPQDGVDILPDQRTQSLYADFHQDLGDRFELSGDAHYGFRIAEAAGAAPTSTLTVTPKDPFFVSPNGAASNQIRYDFDGELPNPVTRATAQSFSATLGGRYQLPHDWAANSYLAYAQEIDTGRSTGLVNSAILGEALGNTPDNPATAYSPARDGYFNPYTGVAANPAVVMQAIGSGFTDSRSKTGITSADLQVDGPLLTLPGGALKLAFGGNVRRETFVTSGTNFLSSVTPIAQQRITGDRTVAAAFAETRIPLVGPDNPLPLVAALEVAAAVRYEHYSDFGSTTNPKVGVTWKPIDDLALRATYGRSFRAPGLSDLGEAALFSPINFPLGTGRVLSLALQGGNPDLKPETATSWTFGADYSPSWLSGLRLSATGFRIDFRNRIDRPVFQNLAGALSDPRFVDFVQRITPATNPADLARISALLNDPAAAAARGLNPATSYLAIVDIRAVNTGELMVNGLDLQASYHGVHAFGGELAFDGTLSRLFKYSEALTPTSAPISLLGQVIYPAKLRGRLSTDWTRGGFSLGATVNYLGAFHDTTGARIDDQTTLDLQARVELPASVMQKTALTLTVRNVFDTAPPFYNNPLGYAFDAANADVVGRFVALQLTRSW